MYGPFKTQFLNNLDLMVDAQLAEKVTLSLQPKLVGLPMFGRIDCDTNYNVEVSAFEKAFLREKCLSTWRKIGAATEQGVTRACLLNTQVMQSVDNIADYETTFLHYSIQTANNNAVYALNQAGYNAQFSQATFIKKAEEEVRITEAHTVKRQLALANAKGHGSCFHVTHGCHMTHDDFFVLSELLVRREQRETLSRKKKLAVQLQCTEEKSLEIIGLGKPIESLSVNELDSLLAWHQVPKTTGAKKADKLEKWKAILAGGQPPPLID
jgi:hypothetical protein